MAHGSWLIKHRTNVSFSTGVVMPDYRRFVRLALWARHLCSSRSTSSFGTAMTRFVRFDSRSIGVLPGTLILISGLQLGGDDIRERNSALVDPSTRHVVRWLGNGHPEDVFSLPEQ